MQKAGVGYTQVTGKLTGTGTPITQKVLASYTQVKGH